MFVKENFRKSDFNTLIRERKKELDSKRLIKKCREK